MQTRVQTQTTFVRLPTVSLCTLVQDNSKQFGACIDSFWTQLVLCAELPTSATCGSTYVVLPGDYCYRIWTNAGLTQDAFLALNPNINCTDLPINWVVCTSSPGSSGMSSPKFPCVSAPKLASGWQGLCRCMHCTH